MGKKHEQDLRLVEGVVAAQLAERDAEIAALRAQVDDLTGKLAYNRNYAAAAFAQQRELINALAAQVAELEAWKAMVPISALLRQYSKTPMGTADYELDAIDVAVWLDAMAPD